jgi:uncharacterized protein (TIGR02117 family)
MGDLALARPDDRVTAGRAALRARSRVRIWGRRIGFGLLIAAGAFVVAAVATARSGDRSLWPPAPGAPTSEMFVVSHGYHSGVIASRRALAEQARRRGLSALGHVATRFATFDWIEVGWGEEHFYRQVPTIQSMTFALAARALLRPGNPSVLHVVGVSGDPRAAFAKSDMIRLKLSAPGFERLADRLDATFVRGGDGEPQALGPGLYGTSLFYRANGAFHLFNVCNHWTARMLDAAGVPTAPVLATFPSGLLLDLEWRSGLARLPPPSP